MVREEYIKQKSSFLRALLETLDTNRDADHVNDIFSVMRVEDRHRQYCLVYNAKAENVIAKLRYHNGIHVALYRENSWYAPVFKEWAEIHAPSSRLGNYRRIAQTRYQRLRSLLPDNPFNGDEPDGIRREPLNRAQARAYDRMLRDAPQTEVTARFVWDGIAPDTDDEDTSEWNII